MKSDAMLAAGNKKTVMRKERKNCFCIAVARANIRHIQYIWIYRGRLNFTHWLEHSKSG